MFLTFGEVMARIAPAGHLRWPQTLPGSVQVTWGGGEANVAASLAMFGHSARYLTALPKQPVAEALVTSLRGLGVDVSQIYWRKEGRLGLYFVEVGANQRGSTVLYDRSHSAISLAAATEYDFENALQDVHWLHVTGITPAISEAAAHANQKLVELAHSRGIAVSCDLNFRKKLWNWRSGTKPKDLARECMTKLLAHVDLVIANEEDAADVLGIHASGTDVTQGHIAADAYEQVARKIATEFASVKRVAITLRESISADHNNWGAMLFDVATDRAHFAPLDAAGNYQPYEIRNIVDRVGAGDSFGAGLLHALSTPAISSPDKAIAFAVAASCLKHSVQGDFNYVTVEEVTALLAGNASGRVQR
ncbi:2-dehydro-3-deoxygluconokinase [Anatilimnocola aggregata]|uniref:2-dehydro-3-deoxygluconokinase n=1 Tax=Anatilimnocola aggregata TaxID=2528021 RepID=A0A517YB05_9BACT|nr:sugar kinase [Anatilimnocola aggregata]QDU27423.1 2-dehydro-3-deoxygluconokinase [Anatilimnocola aggregata]